MKCVGRGDMGVGGCQIGFEAHGGRSIWNRLEDTGVCGWKYSRFARRQQDGGRRTMSESMLWIRMRLEVQSTTKLSYDFCLCSWLYAFDDEIENTKQVSCQLVNPLDMYSARLLRKSIMRIWEKSTLLCGWNISDTLVLQWKLLLFAHDWRQSDWTKNGMKVLLNSKVSFIYFENCFWSFSVCFCFVLFLPILILREIARILCILILIFSFFAGNIRSKSTPIHPSSNGFSYCAAIKVN